MACALCLLPAAPRKQAQPRDFAEQPGNTRDGLKAIVVILHPEFRITYISIDLCSSPLHVKMIPTSLPFVGKKICFCGKLHWLQHGAAGYLMAPAAFSQLRGSSLGMAGRSQTCKACFIPISSHFGKTKQEQKKVTFICNGPLQEHPTGPSDHGSRANVLLGSLWYLQDSLHPASC